MKPIKHLATIMLFAVLATTALTASAAKLADKLSKGAIIVDIEVKGCDADAAKLCPGLARNSRNVFMCLLAYEDNLSRACELGIAEAAMTLEDGLMAIDYSIRACEADADKFCLDVEPGGGRIVGCLRQNESRLNSQCITALKNTGLWALGTR